LEISGLSYTYPNGAKALSDVHLRVEAGESVALLGPNGAGKSTLVLHLNGILRGEGEVRVFGMAVEQARLREIRARVGVVFQDPDDQLFLPTVERDVAFGPENLGLPADEVAARVGRALAAVGLSGQAASPAYHLSLGQKKRAAIATVLSMQPELLVLDEPSANLDPKAKRMLAEVLTGIDLTAIVVTHDLPYACELCDRAVILHEGTVKADGPLHDLLSDSALLAALDLELPLGFDPLRALECSRR
jgi:cobalt transport protein ATP-binding subunit